MEAVAQHDAQVAQREETDSPAPIVVAEDSPPPIQGRALDVSIFHPKIVGFAQRGMVTEEVVVFQQKEGGVEDKARAAPPYDVTQKATAANRDQVLIHVQWKIVKGQTVW